MIISELETLQSEHIHISDCLLHTLIQVVYRHTVKIHLLLCEFTIAKYWIGSLLYC